MYFKSLGIFSALAAVSLLTFSCQKEELNPNPVPKGTVSDTPIPKKKAPAQNAGETTMTGDVLTYAEVQAMPGLTIYNAPSTYTFSIPQGTGTGQWNYASAKLVYNSYYNNISELYIFASVNDYSLVTGCDKKYETYTSGANTWTICDSPGGTCKWDGNCIIKCADPV